MICPNCKSNIPDDTILCPYCTYNVTDYEKNASFSLKNILERRSLRNTTQLGRVTPARIFLPIAFFLIIQMSLVIPFVIFLGISRFSTTKSDTLSLVRYEQRGNGYVGIYKNIDTGEETTNGHIYTTKEEVPLEVNNIKSVHISPVGILIFLFIVIFINILLIKAIIKTVKKYRQSKDTNV